MLVLSRKPNESVILGSNIKVTVLDIRGDKVRLGFEAPNSVPIHREEVVLVARPAIPGDQKAEAPNA